MELKIRRSAGGPIAKHARRVLAGGLAMTMLLPLAACKKKSTSQDNDRKYVSGKEILETDPFFNAEVNEVKLPIDPNKKLTYAGVESCEYTGGLAIVNYYISYELPEDYNMETISFEQGQEYFVNATALFDEKGNFIRELSGDGISFCGVGSDKENNFYMLYYDFDTQNGIEFYVIHVLNQNGEQIRSIRLDRAPLSISAVGGCNIQILDDGRIVINASGKLMMYDKDGKFIREISDVGRTIDGSLILHDGKYYVVSGIYNFDGDSDIRIKEVNIETGELGNGTDASQLIYVGDIETCSEGAFVNTGNACSKFDITTGKTEEVFNWNDTDVDRSLLTSVKCVPKSEDEYFAVGTQYLSMNVKTYLVHLTRAEKNPHAGKKMIVIGGKSMHYDSSLMSFVNAFNSSPDNKARAVIVDYADVIDSDVTMADIERTIYMDILSGTGPDVLVNLGGSPSFNNSSIMEDMNPYLDGSDGIDRTKYFDNVIRACEKDGKLYHIPLSFTLEGVAANSNLVSNTTGWTFEEFEEAGKKMPDQVSFMEGMEYNEVLSFLLCMNMDKFVNYADKTVDFQNDDMKRILEFAKELGLDKKPSDEGMDLVYEGNGVYYGGGDRTQEKYVAGMLAVKEEMISGVMQYAQVKDLLDGGVTFLGYPSLDGTGMCIESNLTMGIVSSSKYKDLAWEFIRAYMDYEIPEDISFFTMPVDRANFDKISHNQMKESNAEYERIVKEGGISAVKGIFAYITEQDIEELKTLIENATLSTNLDPAVMDIIEEEAAAYFAGDRTVDEVLKTIQNRTSTIVKEM
ncbi:MAG: extracellular solute-binding protein [Clostridiales bacterium]|nr:extracellular solute-binding protein [Clostridiales bacterium]